MPACLHPSRRELSSITKAQLSLFFLQISSLFHGSLVEVLRGGEWPAIWTKPDRPQLLCLYESRHVFPPTVCFKHNLRKDNYFLKGFYA